MGKYLKIFAIFILISCFELYPKNQENELQDIYTKFDGEYAVKGNDSIKIINYTMRYALGWSFKRINFESNSFVEYKNYPLKNILDSLKSKYILIDNYHFSQYFHDTFVDSGFVVNFKFLIDSLTFYNFSVYSNDKFLLSKINYYLTKGNYNKKKIIKKLLETKKYGILAYKDSTLIARWTEKYRNKEINDTLNNEDYIEYLHIIKKFNTKKSK